jgi:hypothetical protein
MDDIVLDSLAGARLTVLVTRDKIAEAPRNWLLGQARRRLPAEWSAKARFLFSCPWCMGWWVGVAVTLVRRTTLWRWARYPLAISAVAGVVETATG